MEIEYKTTVQPLWRNSTGEHFHKPGGQYLAPTAPVVPPPEPAEWTLHSVQPLNLPFGEASLLIVWMRECSAGELTTGELLSREKQPWVKPTLTELGKRDSEGLEP